MHQAGGGDQLVGRVALDEASSREVRSADLLAVHHVLLSQQLSNVVVIYGHILAPTQGRIVRLRVRAIVAS
jgi:hypothetical protein